MPEKIQRTENNGIGVVMAGAECFTYETSYINNSMSIFPLTEFYKGEPFRIGDFKILPYGENNLLPFQLRKILNESSLAPEILNKQAQLLFGQGPALYKYEYIDGKRQRVYVDDKNILSWLNSWDYQDYLLKAVVELRHCNGHFTKVYRNKMARIDFNKSQIHHLEHLSSAYARLEWAEPTQKSRNIIVGDYLQPYRRGLTSYPIWNKSNINSIAISYDSIYTYALDNDYALPSYYGSLRWIKLANTIANLLTSYTDNSIALKYHVKVPLSYWLKKKDAIMQKCMSEGTEYNDKMLETIKDKAFANISAALAGITNAGKFISTETFFDDLGGEYVEWKIEVLDQKVKNFIDAQLNISQRAAFETTAGIGLHPALSNISADGNLPSGSEQLYAFKLYLLTGIDIAEYTVCKTINEAIAINFPNTDLKLGFYHDVVITEEKTAPKDRIKNN